MSSLFVLVLMGSGMLVIPGYYDSLEACKLAGQHHYWETSFECIPAPRYAVDGTGMR